MLENTPWKHGLCLICLEQEREEHSNYNGSIQHPGGIFLQGSKSIKRLQVNRY
ncbi:hypothetical protein GIB67_010899 [Kingdonia uniflora]|uniref:Uncharacterized protein n=1 Tax=Kingdonia uniflora TaxID=39325 RepID=A0A7J7M4N3_9MAGN|nr:hypothetical protein GIB67_010899 [Kingdonia uniflora]